MLDSREATWLRAVFRHALNAALATSLGAAGCSSDEELVCAERKPLLLSEVKPASRYDYASLRVAYPGSSDMERATRGEACSGAQDTTACLTALDAITDDLEKTEVCGMIAECRRYLVTTAGDEVKLYDSREELLEFLGPIDAPEDALLLLDYDKYSVECDETRVASTSQGFVVKALLSLDIGACSAGTASVRLQVSPDGTVKELTRNLLPAPDTNVCVGRRPAGLISSNIPRTRSVLGDHFAAMAQLEAASVAAFEVLAVELEQHGAPAELIAAARSAALDEVRHAAMTSRLAKRFGVSPAAPRVAVHPLRTLEAIALDNVTEGCVRETFGAMLGCYQAATASDAQIAAVMRTLADDETRHAALALQIEHWIMPRVTPEVRMQLMAARAEAVRALRDELEQEPSAELRELAGVPDASTAAKLHANLSHALWQAHQVGARERTSALES
jgi:hypothetical protein